MTSPIAMRDNSRVCEDGVLSRTFAFAIAKRADRWSGCVPSYEPLRVIAYSFAKTNTIAREYVRVSRPSPIDWSAHVRNKPALSLDPKVDAGFANGNIRYIKISQHKD
jgi:hypothetical protein